MGWKILPQCLRYTLSSCFFSLNFNSNFLFQCEWDKLKSGDNCSGEEKAKSKRVQKFLRKYYKKRPLTRLCPRTALRGGKVEAYFTDCHLDASQSAYRMLHLDYNSL